MDGSQRKTKINLEQINFKHGKQEITSNKHQSKPGRTDLQDAGTRKQTGETTSETSLQHPKIWHRTWVEIQLKHMREECQQGQGGRAHKWQKKDSKHDRKNEKIPEKTKSDLINRGFRQSFWRIKTTQCVILLYSCICPSCFFDPNHVIDVLCSFKLRDTHSYMKAILKNHQGEANNLRHIQGSD